ncbi:MAG: anhydro-N-acetylmuramic acid kinase [Legionellaceae bacterium]|nr:anhydro-N-acetylmuramic acid kinase [Legionellaceae bacterium]
MKLYIGLMSGTSMDGIDAALVDVVDNRLIAGITRPYSQDTRLRLGAVLCGERLLPSALSQLNTVLGVAFAAAVQELLTTTDVSLADVIAIGSHGQTICHDALADIPYTIQLGCPHTISELTGMTVVADFRTRDMVLGGKGAPYAPLYHQVLFGHWADAIAVVNVGGIANITSFTVDKQVSGYDTGPGNCLMDTWVRLHLQTAYDVDGVWASTGKVISPLLDALLSDTYFQQSSPKSIGKEYFSLGWLTPYLQANYKAEDVQATLLTLTATSIARAVKHQTVQPTRLAVCGGGAHNQELLRVLKAQLPGVDVGSTQSLGVNPDYLEAMMFAWLADKTITHTPLDLSSITGSRKSAILGAIYPYSAALKQTTPDDIQSACCRSGAIFHPK